MTNLILFLVILALLGYAIERNHRRQRPGRMSGSVNYEDRDEGRITEELRGLPPSREEGAAGRPEVPRMRFVAVHRP
jgi:hypothetical protein